MKILLLSPYIPFPINSGGKFRTASIINALRRHEVFLVALQDPDQPADYTELKKHVKGFKVVSHKQRFAWRDSFYKKVLRLIYTLLGIPTPVVSASNPEFAKLVESYIEEIDPDMVVVDILWLVQYISLIKGRFFRVLNAHNVESDAFRTIRRNFLFWWPVWKVWERYEAKVIKNFDLILTTSENEKRRFLELYEGGNYLVVPNAVNTKTYKFNSYTRRKGLVFTGDLGYLPNVDAVRFFVKDVLPLVKKEIPEVELSIVGSNPFPEVVSLEEVPGVRVFANVPDAKPYITNAAAFVVPIRSGAGTRIKILEAFALGTPVISTPFGAKGLQVDPEKNILFATDRKSFSDAVISILKDRRLAKKIAGHARSVVEEKYSWDKVDKMISENLTGIGDKKKETN